MANTRSTAPKVFKHCLSVIGLSDEEIAYVTATQKVTTISGFLAIARMDGGMDLLFGDANALTLGGKANLSLLPGYLLKHFKEKAGYDTVEEDLSGNSWDRYISRRDDADAETVHTETTMIKKPDGGVFKV